jgi:hypothetical protein
MNRIVIDAYNRSLKVTFMSAIAMFVIANVLVFTIKLPNIKRKEEDREGSAIAAADPGDE